MPGTRELAEAALSPMPEPGPDRDRLVQARLDLARATLADKGGTAAAEVLEQSLRAGLWRSAALWQEFAALPDDRVQHARVRQLWLDSPRQCHRMCAVIVVCARAAALAGDHDDARGLMRKAILLRANQRHQLARRAKRLIGMSKPQKRAATPLYTATDDQGRDTSRYFALYDALTAEDRPAIATETAALRELGETTWLTRI